MMIRRNEGQLVLVIDATNTLDRPPPFAPQPSWLYASAMARTTERWETVGRGGRKAVRQAASRLRRLWRMRHELRQAAQVAWMP